MAGAAEARMSAKGLWVGLQPDAESRKAEALLTAGRVVW